MAEAARQPARLTAGEYFAVEAVSLEKHELIDGRLYSMAGGSPVHAQLTSRLAAVIGPQIIAGRCEGYSSDLRVALGAAAFAYPDYTAICGEPMSLPENLDTVTNPTVVFEVLSPTTEAYDRGGKRAAYSSLPSVQSVVLVAQDRPFLEVYDRQTGDSWLLKTYQGLEAVAPLPSIECEIELGALYRRVPLSQPGEPPSG